MTMEMEVSKIEHKITMRHADISRWEYEPGNYLQVNFMAGRKQFVILKILDNNSEYSTVASVIKGVPRSALNVRGSDLKFVDVDG